eukprot:1887489-Alexandrium_andersonii.AAC.1
MPSLQVQTLRIPRRRMPMLRSATCTDTPSAACLVQYVRGACPVSPSLQQWPNRPNARGAQKPGRTSPRSAAVARGDARQARAP